LKDDERKYRRLTSEELELLEDDLIQFLAANSVTADDWERLKQEEPDKAMALIDRFSDIVFEKVLSKEVDLEHRSPKKLKLFRCEEERIRLMGLDLPSESPIDMTDPEAFRELMEDPKKHGTGAELYKAEKGYNKEREEEIKEMLDQGCRLTEKRLFTLLEKLHGGA
jgi:hypothetical protein